MALIKKNYSMLPEILCKLSHRMSCSDWRLHLPHLPTIWPVFWVIALSVHSMDDYSPLWQDKHTVSCLKDFPHSEDLKVELQRRWISKLRDLLLCCEFSFLCRSWSAVWSGVWRDGCQRGRKGWAQTSCDAGSFAQGQVKFALSLMKAATFSCFPALVSYN